MLNIQLADDRSDLVERSKEPAWTVSLQTQRVDPACPGFLVVAFEELATGNAWNELLAAIETAILLLLVRRSRHVHVYRGIARRQRVSRKRDGMMRRLLDCIFLHVSDEAGKVLVHLILDAGEDVWNGPVDLEALSRACMLQHDQVSGSLAELATRRMVAYSLVAGKPYYHLCGSVTGLVDQAIPPPLQLGGEPPRFAWPLFNTTSGTGQLMTDTSR